MIYTITVFLLLIAGTAGSGCTLPALIPWQSSGSVAVAAPVGNKGPITSSVQSDNDEDRAVLTIQIRNGSSEFALVRDNHWKPVNEPSDSGKESSTYKTDVPSGFYSLTYNDGTAHFFVGANDLSISFDGSDFLTSLTYEGGEKEECDYLTAKDRLTRSLPMSQRQFSIYAKLDEKDFAKQAHSIQGRYAALLAATEKQLDPKFVFLETNSLLIEQAIRLYEYQGQRRLVTKAKTFKVSGEYPDPFAGIDLNNPELLHTYGYLKLVGYYYARIVNGLIEEDKALNFFNAFMEVLSSAELDARIKDELGLANAQYGFAHASDIENYYETYMGFATIDRCRDAFAAQYDATRAAKGRPSPDFELIGVDNSSYSLGDFRGQYVYIDIWASWCSPCVEQIPHLQELERDLKEDIAFVSIAWKDSRVSWEKMVSEMDLGGVQLFATDAEAKFFRYYDVESSGIPRFILLDRKGCIIESNAKRPSNPELKSQLMSLE